VAGGLHAADNGQEIQDAGLISGTFAKSAKIDHEYGFGFAAPLPDAFPDCGPAAVMGLSGISCDHVCEIVRGHQCGSLSLRLASSLYAALEQHIKIMGDNS
tara:strand:+ start:223 stop:525 length:303 start_codon:yes stop_codon:yes gene_type:complete